MKSKLKMGNSLSGERVRGISHLGVLKALAEVGIVPTKVSVLLPCNCWLLCIVKGYLQRRFEDYCLKRIISNSCAQRFPLQDSLKMDAMQSLFKILSMLMNDLRSKTPLSVAGKQIFKKG